MTIDKINEMHTSIITALGNNELKYAFDTIRQLIEQEEVSGMIDQLNELESTYQNMLRYRINGIKDPVEGKIHSDLIGLTAELAESVRLNILTRKSSYNFYSFRRNSPAIRNQSFSDICSTIIHTLYNRSALEEANKNLFYRIWTSDLLTATDVKAIKSFFEDEDVLMEVKCTSVTALMLALLEVFDKEKLLLLMDLTDSEDVEVKIRAYVALFVTLYVYKDQTSFYPQIKNRLEALAEKEGFIRILRNVTLSFIMARDTEKVADKIREEILPEMMKIDKLVNTASTSKNSIMEQLESGLNPEWEKTFTNKKIEKALSEYQKLQNEGADVMHMPFANMKYFPFFQEIVNWFMPFTLEQSNLMNMLQGEEEKKVLSSIFSAIPLCHSDKYSLAFSLLGVSSQIRKSSLDMFKSVGDQLDTSSEWKNLQQNQAHQIEMVGRLYIQDLYRFYKLNSIHFEMKDIFAMKLDFQNVPLLRPYLSDVDSLLSIGEYYMREGHYEDALVLFDRLSRIEESDILWEKIGYCKQMMEDWEGALVAYLRSELLNSTVNKWLISHIAICYRALKQPEMALEYYQRYEKLNPDDLSIQISMGNCYLSMKEYDKALNYFFKVEYLDTKTHKAWRPIAWCSLLAGKYDQARSYYQKLLNKKPSAQDYLNAGHTEWVMENIKGALEFYCKAINKEKGIEDFFILFRQDIPSLCQLGIEKKEITFMQEQLRYYSEGKL